MAYADLLSVTGVGAAFRIDVSLNNFSTIAYRYATHGGLLDGTNEYQSNIITFGSISRGFGDGGLAASAMLELVLENTDEQVDWLMDISEANFPNIFKAKFRVYSVLFSPASPSNFFSKKLGDFYIGDMPSRNNDSVSVPLVDAVASVLDQVISLPTLDDWRNNPGETEDTCPLKSVYFENEFAEGVSFSTAAPLAFGEDRVRGIPLGHTANFFVQSSDFLSKMVSVVCATTNTGAGGAEMLSELWVRGKKSGEVVAIPKTAFLYGGLSYEGTYTIWEPKKTGAIAKNGINYSILYCTIDTRYINAYLNQVKYEGIDEDFDVAFGEYTKQDAGLSAAYEFYHVGGDLSARIRAGKNQTGADVVYDLVSFYTSGLTSSDVEPVSFAKVKAATNSSANVSGVIGGFWAEQKSFSGDSMRATLSKICASCDFDLFVNWGGLISLSCDSFSYLEYTGVNGATLFRVDEELTAEVDEYIPSEGQRGAVFNRAFVRGGRSVVAPKPGDSSTLEPVTGPWDNAALVSSYGRVIPRTFDVTWLSLGLAREDPFLYRLIIPKPRTRVRFTTDLTGLSLDLGDLFYFNWTRNLGAGDPYTDAIFRVESIAYNTDDHSVSIDALWSDNLATSSPYLLDDETFIIRATGSGGRTVSITQSSAVMTFSSGSLTTDGVVANDFMILKDTGEAENTSKRNRAIKILTVDSATQLTITGDQDYGQVGTIAYSGWQIRRSKLTYPTAISDPTNYPDGSAMYGKTSTVADLFTDSTEANRLING